MALAGKIAVERATGRAIEPYLDALARLRISVFREFPYLYEGTLDYERTYLASYAASDQNVVVIARDGERVVGAATAMPALGHEDVQDVLDLAGYDVTRVCYFGESVLDAAYRGRGLGNAFFDERIAHAREHDFAIAAFCAVDRPSDHPLRPADYRKLDGLWMKYGFVRNPDIVTEFTWRDRGDDHETPKRMVFWVRDPL